MSAFDAIRLGFVDGLKRGASMLPGIIIGSALGVYIVCQLT